MIIDRVELRNFLSHKNTSVSFPLGVVALVGPNGAGKTSILDAISFALLKENSRGRSLEELIRRRASSCEVRIEFRVGKDLYSLTRSLTKVGRSVRSDAKLYRNGTLLAMGDKEVSNELSTILPVDKSLFLNAVYVRQGEIDKLLTAQPHERKKIIGKLLRLNDLEEAWNNMKELIYKYRERLAKLEGVLRSKVEYESKLKEVLSKLREVERRSEEACRRREKVESELKAVESRLRALEELSARHARLKERLINLGELERALKGEVLSLAKALREAVGAERKLEALRPALSLIPLYEEYVERHKELRGVEEVLRVLEERWRRVETLKKVLAENAPSYKRYLELERRIREVEARLEELKEVPGAYKKLVREREEVEERLAKVREEVAREMKALGLGTDVEPDAEILRRVSEELKEEERSIEEDLEGLKEEKGEALGKLELLEARLAELKEEPGVCPLCGSKLDEERSARLFAEAISEAERLRERAADIDGRIAELNKRLREVKESERAVNELLVRVREALSSLRERSERLAEEVNRLRRIYEEYSHLEEELGELRAERASLLKRYEEYLAAEKELKGSDEEDLKGRLESYRKRGRELLRRVDELRRRLGLAPGEAERRLEELREAKSSYERLSGLAAKKGDVLARLGELRERLERLRVELAQATYELEALGYDESEHSSLRGLQARLSSELKVIEEEVYGLEAEAKALKERVVEYESALREVRSAEKEYWRLKGFIDFLSRLRKLYGKDGIQRKIRDLSRPLIEKNVRELVRLFELDYFDVKIDEDYNVTLVGPLGEHTVSMISGGERIALALALRLALAKVIAGSEIEFMLLDEPTIHLDEERRRDLVKVLRRVFSEKGIIPQLIIVTHDRELEEAADIVYRVEKGNEGSRIEKVNEI